MSGMKPPRRIYILLACVCVVIIVAGTIVLTNPAKEPPANSFPEIGYQMTPALDSEGFSSPPSGVQLSVNNASMVQYAYSAGGLIVTFNQTSSALYVTSSSTSSTNQVRFVLNASVLDDNHLMSVLVNFKVKETPWWYYGLRIELAANMINLIPVVWLGPGTPIYQNYCFLYDVSVRGTIDVVVQVVNGNLVVGVDGFETTLKTDYKAFTDLQYDRTTLASDSDNWSTPSNVVLKKFELGNNAQIVYHDRLHRTTTPGGYDFTLALQIHADYITPSQLALMTYLSNTYGIRGVMTIWMNTSDSDEYSIDTN
ncbi:MAG TPA: hypothetical protein VEH08_01260, partial [Methanomassiliicoccales archaeon]|nr:hypothetical protein [Methanomassiliicoccales archaeon]